MTLEKNYWKSILCIAGALAAYKFSIVLLENK